MGYNEELAAISRTPVTLAELDLDACSRTFGTAPCNATGVPCYNTRQTCRYASAYNKQVTTHQYTSANVSTIPFAGPLPYVNRVTVLATEIKTNLTAAGRSTVEFYDEPDDDITLDPYRDIRYGVPVYAANCTRAAQASLSLAMNYTAGDWSVDLWARITDTQAGQGDCIAAMRKSGNAEVWEFQSDINAGGLRFYVNGGNNWQECVVTTGIASNEWHHYLFTHGNATKQIIAYVDGNAAGNLTYTGNLATGSSLLSFGARYATQGYMGVQLAAARLWSATLSGSSPGLLYHAGLGVTWRGMNATLKTYAAGAWDLGNESGNRADQSGHGLTLTESYGISPVTVAAGPATGQPAAPSGTYWRKLVTRNPHYRGRPARILQGFTGLARNAFQEVWRGQIDNVTLGKGSAKVEIIDELKALDKLEIPRKVTCKVVSDVDANATTITVTDVQALDLGGQTLDGGFEYGNNYWSQSNGTVTIGDANNARTGSKCAAFASNGWLACAPPRPCTANETLFVLGWQKVTGNAAGNGYVGATFYDANNTAISTLYHNNNNGTAATATYAEMTGTVTAPAGAAYFQPMVSAIGSNWNGTLCMDDVLVFRANQTYIKTGDEIIQVGAASYANNSLSSLTRGCFATESHNCKAKDKVQPCRVYGPANPFDLLQEMLAVDAGFLAAQVNATAFNDAKTFPGGEAPMWGILTDPTKLGDTYFDLLDLLDCKSWVGEDLQVTVRRNLQNRPGRNAASLTDDTSLVKDSTSLDLNQKSRISRVMLYWDKPALEKLDDYAKYNRLDGAVDEAAESEAEYGEVAEKVVGCRWLDQTTVSEERMTAFVTAFTMRRVWMYRDPQPLLKGEVELKDSGIKTGDYVQLTTDEVPTLSGGNSTGTWEVVKRETKGDKGTITLTLLKCKDALIGYWGANSANDYNNATPTERLETGYWTEDDGTINGNKASHWW